MSDVQKTFEQIWQENYWRSKESVSGPGSTLLQTTRVREFLPYILRGLGIQSMLNIPCGDLQWFHLMLYQSHWTVPSVLHADIVPGIIEKNRQLYPDQRFEILDICSSFLPKAEVVFVRDCLGHLSNQHVQQALENITASGSTYLMATHFPDGKWRTDVDIEDGGWRPINLAVQFGLGDPILSLNEGLMVADGAYKDKALGLWRMNP